MKKSSKKRAPLKSVSTELMREFYEEASALYEQAPWETCENGDLFGVVIPETSELHFVSIMGNGGQCFGLATYRGYEGLQLFGAVMNGAGFDDPEGIRRRQDGLLLEFVHKRFLDEFDKLHVKTTGFAPVDRSAWVIVRDLSPGWVPWSPSEKDIIALRHVLAVVPSFAAKQEKDASWCYGTTGEKLPIFVFKKGVWIVEWWSESKIAKHDEKWAPRAAAIQPVDELAMARLAKIPRAPDTTWEIHSFFASEAVLEDDRPFYPRICTLLDQASGFCFAIEMATPTQPPAFVFRDMIVKKIIELGKTPQTIATSDMRHLIGLIALKEVLGIAVKIQPSQAGAALEIDFKQNAEFKRSRPRSTAQLMSE